MANKVRKSDWESGFWDLLSDMDLTDDNWMNDFTSWQGPSDYDFTSPIDFISPDPYDPTGNILAPGMNSDGSIDIVGGGAEPNPYDPTSPVDTQDPYDPTGPSGDRNPFVSVNPHDPTGPSTGGSGGGGSGGGGGGGSGGGGGGGNTPGVKLPTPTPGGGGGGGGGGNQTGFGTNFSMLNPAYLPLLGALLQGYQGYKDSNEWKDFANDQRDILDPFGKQRPGYQQLLADYYKDPSGTIERLPGFRAARDLATRQLVAKSGSQLGGGLNGTLPTWVLDRSSELAALHADQYEKNLHNLSGAQFGPGEYGRVATTAMQESQGARNNALMALAMALSGGGSLLSGGTSGSTSGGAQDLWKWIQQNILQGGGGGSLGGGVNTGAPGSGDILTPIQDGPAPNPHDPTDNASGPPVGVGPGFPQYPTPEDDNYVPPNPPEPVVTYPVPDQEVITPQSIANRGFLQRRMV